MGLIHVSGVFVVLLISNSEASKNLYTNASGLESYQRQPKLFLSISFDNTPCKATTGDLYGVCKRGLDCVAQNGKEIGKCGNGAGSCCQLFVTPSPLPNKDLTITESAVTIMSSGVANSNSIINFPRNSQVCQLKVNFLQTKFEKPSTDPLRWGRCTRDVFTITGSQSYEGLSLKVCGDMVDQHMYLSYGMSSNNPSKNIRFSIKTTSASTKYAINVVQLKCGSPEIVPDNCLQQWSSDTGRIRTFGFPIQLEDQNYNICFRGRTGVTGRKWQECRGLGNTRPFFITGIDENGVPFPPQEEETSCSYDRVQFLTAPDGQAVTPSLCGGGFPARTVTGNNGALRVNFDNGEQTHSFTITNIPPSTNCEALDQIFYVHTCRGVQAQEGPACICSVKPQFFNSFSIPVPPTSPCPRVVGIRRYYCTKSNDNMMCDCVQMYDEADQKNTGFCLEYTSIL